VSRYQKGKTNLDFIEARDSEWKWHQLGHMQVCTSLQTDNHTITPPLSFLQAGCPSWCPTDNVKASPQYKLNPAVHADDVLLHISAADLVFIWSAYLKNMPLTLA